MSRERLASEYAAEVERWRERGLARSLARPLSTSLGTVATIDFTSNDYLGLSTAPELVAATIRAVTAHGASGRASRLLGGGCPTTLDVERRYAEWIGAESALILPSGYQANLSLLPAIAERGDCIVSDELNHASLIDAMKLSGATVKIYQHGDAEHAARLLQGARGARRRYLVTESVFSMDGDLAPLLNLERACADYGAGLIIDEAHAAGVLGPEGRGACAAVDVQPLVRIITGGKALGAAGGLILGPTALTDLLIHKGRGFVFSTAITPAVTGALDAALDHIVNSDEARARLRQHAATIATAVGAGTAEAAIVPVPVGCDVRAVEWQNALANQGLDVRAVRPPTVPEGTARLRVVCRANHTAEEVLKLTHALSGLQASQPRTESIVVAGPTSSAPRCRPLFIVGTDTDIGKTVVSAAAVLALDAHYWKPVQTGTDSDTEEVERLAGPYLEGAPQSARSIAPPRYAFALPASPHTAAEAEGARVDIDELEAALWRHVASAGDTRVVAELAGGLFVPLHGAATQADWLRRRRPTHRKPDVLLVARSSLGTLNHTLLTLEALRARRLEPKALVLVGEPHAANAATLRRHVPHLFELPRFTELDRAALVGWLAQNDLKAALDD